MSFNRSARTAGADLLAGKPVWFQIIKVLSNSPDLPGVTDMPKPARKIARLSFGPTFVPIRTRKMCHRRNRIRKIPNESARTGGISHQLNLLNAWGRDAASEYTLNLIFRTAPNLTEKTSICQYLETIIKFFLSNFLPLVLLQIELPNLCSWCPNYRYFCPIGSNPEKLFAEYSSFLYI